MMSIMATERVFKHPATEKKLKTCRRHGGDDALRFESEAQQAHLPMKVGAIPILLSPKPGNLSPKPYTPKN